MSNQIEAATSVIPIDTKLDLIIIATGVLYQNNITPEKSIKELSYSKFQKIFAINTIGPALVAKHFIKLLRNDQKAIFVCISARVRSISDNQLGGWYAYRSSKAALNMVIKNLSIEIARKNKDTIIISLHPGTVDSNLSKPFESSVKKDKLFTPEYSVSLMTEVIKKLKLKDSGKIFAYDGKKIEY